MKKKTALHNTDRAPAPLFLHEREILIDLLVEQVRLRDEWSKTEGEPHWLSLYAREREGFNVIIQKLEALPASPAGDPAS